MMKYCLQQWEANKEKLRKAFKSQKGWNDCNYKDLVVAVVENILNPSDTEFSKWKWDSEHITEIDDGECQGTLLFLIPEDIYQPAAHEYLMTYVGYGSCSGCDTLMCIQDEWCERLKNAQIDDFMNLCKDIITNMIKPYNSGWRNEEMFNEINMEEICL